MLVTVILFFEAELHRGIIVSSSSQNRITSCATETSSSINSYIFLYGIFLRHINQIFKSTDTLNCSHTDSYYRSFSVDMKIKFECNKKIKENITYIGKNVYMDILSPFPVIFVVYDPFLIPYY